jgi:hypothetical protein
VVGFPKHLNTKQDYLYIKEHFPEEQWLPEFQRLMDDRMAWLNIGQLASEGDGIVDETHRVVTVGGEEEGVPVQYYQYEYKEDSNCKLFRLGFTVAEVEEVIKF